MVALLMPASACRGHDPGPPPWPAPPALPIFAGNFAAGGRLIHKEEPAYPEALRRPYPREVRILCTVNERGEIAKAEVEAGPPELRPFALAAVRQWRYEPTRLYNFFIGKGTPVPVIITVIMRFDKPPRRGYAVH